MIVRKARQITYGGPASLCDEQCQLQAEADMFSIDVRELVNSLDLVAQQVQLYVWNGNLQFMCVEIVKLDSLFC